MAEHAVAATFQIARNPDGDSPDGGLIPDESNRDPQATLPIHGQTALQNDLQIAWPLTHVTRCPRKSRSMIEEATGWVVTSS
jgi:hypothetical protein